MRGQHSPYSVASPLHFIQAHHNVPGLIFGQFHSLNHNSLPNHAEPIHLDITIPSEKEQKGKRKNEKNIEMIKKSGLSRGKLTSKRKKFKREIYQDR